METLTPVQRVAVIAIGLALTAFVALLILPWVWKQIVEWLPIADTAVPATPLPTATPDRISLSDGATDDSMLPGRPTWTDSVPS